VKYRFATTTAVTILLTALMACTILRPGPAATVKQFYKSVEAGNLDDAIKLLSGQLRSQIGDQKLRAALAEQARDIKQRQQGIRSISVEKEDVQGQIATVTLLLTFGDGTTKRDVTKLVLENNSWKISPSK
jgi:hypothetical protein